MVAAVTIAKGVCAITDSCDNDVIQSLLRKKKERERTLTIFITASAVPRNWSATAAGLNCVGCNGESSQPTRVRLGCAYTNTKRGEGFACLILGNLSSWERIRRQKVGQPTSRLELRSLAWWSPAAYVTLVQYAVFPVLLFLPSSSWYQLLRCSTFALLFFLLFLLWHTFNYCILVSGLKVPLYATTLTDPVPNR